MVPWGGQVYWIRISPWVSAKVMVLVSQIVITVEAARWRLARTRCHRCGRCRCGRWSARVPRWHRWACADAPGAVRWCAAEGLGLLG